VLGFGSTFAAPKRGEAQSTAPRQAMEIAMRAAKLSPAAIGHVNASGLSTIQHDRAEAEAIASLFADVPVTAPKSLFGNLGASTGAVELAASIIAIDERSVPATINYDQPDAACPINVIHGAPERLTRTAAIVFNQSPHGQSVAMAIAADA
jgi:3-oxoacyl-[acyl-carrier-protein] synthase II